MPLSMEWTTNDAGATICFTKDAARAIATQLPLLLDAGKLVLMTSPSVRSVQLGQQIIGDVLRAAPEGWTLAATCKPVKRSSLERAKALRVCRMTQKSSS